MRKYTAAEQDAYAVLRVLGWYHGSKRLDEPEKHKCSQGHSSYYTPCPICVALNQRTLTQGSNQ